MREIVQRFFVRSSIFDIRVSSGFALLFFLFIIEFYRCCIRVAVDNQSFPYEIQCACYKKIASRSWPVLFILTYFSPYTYPLLFCRKIKSCCDRCFPQQIRPQATVQWYILRDYSCIKIGFNIINKRHTLHVA